MHSGGRWNRFYKTAEMKKADEKGYIAKRLRLSRLQSIPFYLCRIFPIKRNKVVFTTIEGTTGFTCNPKYIALELLHDASDQAGKVTWQMVWLVDDLRKEFPDEIKKIRNTLWNRAYHLSTAGVWIDNSRKQLEVRKRRGQLYIQTWHAKIGFKPTCLDRGSSFSRIAYLVSKHDSDMVDYWLSNSDWYDKTLKNGSLYEGKVLRTGSPRCDILVRAEKNPDFKEELKQKILFRIGRNSDSENKDLHFLMYAPTFRGGSQKTERAPQAADHMPELKKLSRMLQERFGGKWIIILRLHPQLTVRNISYAFEKGAESEPDCYCADVSKVDDMYELLAGCDAFLTDYSSAAFDAAVMKMPVFLYCDDYAEYEQERGKLLWDLKQLPFPFAENDEELWKAVNQFDSEDYQHKLDLFFRDTGMKEDGKAAERVVDFIEKNLT